jgi:hypothetical protein
VPEFSFVVGSAGAVGRHINVPNRRLRLTRARSVRASDVCALPSPRKANIMQVPANLKPALWGAVGGAIALAIVGFSWGGWMTSHSAGKLADERADMAVVAALTPICVDKFRQAGEATANLVALKKISSTWAQGDYIEKGGWATRPGAASPDYQLARACAEKLMLPKTAAQ